MKSRTVIDLEKLPRSARNELLDFYEFLSAKYTGKKKSVSHAEEARLFCERARRRSFVLPGDYRFDRDEIHER